MRSGWLRVLPPAGSPGPVGPNGGHPEDCRWGGWLPSPSPPAQVQEAQERDAALVHVQSWLAAGKRPEWADVAALDTETRVYHSQWASLEVRDGVLYRLQPRRQVSRPDPFPPETLLVRLGETGGEHRGGNEHPHI
ncbi:hypothetical protein AAFF_G00033770 [Aldrovandia affinis]|uniref:Uncharacterized protein n=1 Tax=Aldrovandia affinis TaxID=143900 RepID=A0AAD7S416_9TELE|nr:hypothetical protein AAFF_G00033770 [Aldrovandia affinis]